MASIFLILLFLLISVFICIAAGKRSAGAYVIPFVQGFWPGLALHTFMYESLMHQIPTALAISFFLFVSSGVLFAIVLDMKGFLKYTPVIILSGIVPGIFGFPGSLLWIIFICMLLVNSLAAGKAPRLKYMCIMGFPPLVSSLIKGAVPFLNHPFGDFGGGILIYYCFACIFTGRKRYDTVSASAAILGFMAALLFYF